MSTFLTEATLRTVTATRYGAISNGLDLLAVSLLICLLVVQLLLRTLGGVAGRRADMLDMAIWPLVLVMVVGIVLRLVQLLPAG